jgi:hypothetical protein
MTIVRAERFEVESRLAALGLTMEELHRTFKRAQAERSACTGLDPITLPGVLFWGRVIRFAREAYVPEGLEAEAAQAHRAAGEPRGDVRVHGL